MERPPTATHYDLRGEAALRRFSPAAERARHAARLRDPLAGLVHRFLEERLPLPPRPGATLLDLCCGTGPFAVFPAESGYDVTGVDLSPASLASARARLAAHGLSATLKEADAAAYLGACPAECFDAIQCVASLYYLERSAVLPAIVRALRPGGVFLAVETNGSNFLANTLRRVRSLTRGDRDERTLRRLHRLADFDAIRAYFADSEVRYLYFLGLVGAFLPASIGSALAACDDVLFARLGARALSFKVCIAGRKAG